MGSCGRVGCRPATQLRRQQLVQNSPARPTRHGLEAQKPRRWIIIIIRGERVVGFPFHPHMQQVVRAPRRSGIGGIFAISICALRLGTGPVHFSIRVLVLFYCKGWPRWRRASTTEARIEKEVRHKMADVWSEARNGGHRPSGMDAPMRVGSEAGGSPGPISP